MALVTVGDTVGPNSSNYYGNAYLDATFHVATSIREITFFAVDAGTYSLGIDGITRATVTVAAGTTATFTNINAVMSAGQTARVTIVPDTPTRFRYSDTSQVPGVPDRYTGTDYDFTVGWWIDNPGMRLPWIWGLGILSDPREIPNLKAWYSAQAVTGLANGATMTTWNDLSGNNNHATAQTVNTTKPVWQATTGPGGGPAVYMGVGGGYFTLPTNLMTAAAAGEVMTYLKGDAVKAGVSQGFWKFGTDAQTNHWGYTSNVYDDFGRTTRDGTNITGETNVWRRLNISTATNDYILRLDEAQQVARTSGVTVGWRATPQIGNGAPSPSSGGAFKGHHSALMLYDRKLTAAERADLSAWLIRNPSGGTAPPPLSAYAQAVMADAPSGFWRLNDAAGSTAMADSSGNNRNGTYQNTSRITYQQPGGLPTDTDVSVSFWGGSFGGTAVLPVSAVAGNDFSVEWWTKNIVTPLAGATNFYSGHGMVNADMSGTTNDWGTALASNGSIVAGVGNPDTNIIGTRRVNDDRWHHVVFTRSKADGAIRLYIDGNLEASGTGGIQTLNSPSEIAVSMVRGGANRLVAQWDDIATYNTVLSETRVRAHYAAAGYTLPAQAAFTGTGSLTVTGAVAHLTGQAAFAGAGSLSVIAVERHHATADFSGGGTFSVALTGAVEASASFTGDGLLGVDGFALTERISVGNVAFTSSGILSVSGRRVSLPELVVQILNPNLKRAPTTVTVAVANAWPRQLLNFFVDGNFVWSARADADGMLRPTTLDVSRGSSGSHTMRVEQDNAIFGVATFTLRDDDDFNRGEDDPNFPIAMGPDADPVDISSAYRDNGTRAWVWQDLYPSEYGGLGSWVMDTNPTKMSNPHLERRYSVLSTTVPVRPFGAGGQFHVMEGMDVPKEWTFEGYCPTEAMQNLMLRYRNLNHRFYIIDHHRRAWKVHITNIEFTAHRHQDYALFPQHTKMHCTEWGHDYVVHAVVLSQNPVEPV